MKIRGLLFAIIILGGLLGALYWSNRHKPADKDEAAASSSPKILQLKEDGISKIDLKKKGGNDILLAKDSAGKWQMTAPETYGVDQDTINNMVSALSALDAERTVEDKASDLGQYGLSDPALQVTVTEKDNKTHDLLLGDDTAASGAVYAKLGGDAHVYTVSKYSKESIDKGVNDLRDKRLLTVDSEKISKVELAGKKPDIEFGRNKDEWQIVKPKPMRADTSSVDELVNALTDAKMDLGGSEDDLKKAASAFASGTPVATAKVTDLSGTQELQVRKSKDNTYYAKSSIITGAYKVENTLGQALAKNLDDFRNKKLFDFESDDPTKVEIHDGAKAYYLTKGGDDWFSGDGKKLDGTSADAVVDGLRELSATKFPDSGFTTPVMQITVTSNENKRVEKVAIAKAATDYIAKRDGDASLYELDAKSIDDLQKAEAGLKPAAPPPGKK